MSIRAMPSDRHQHQPAGEHRDQAEEQEQEETSTASTTVVEAKKSRTISYSETRRAKAPVLPWRLGHRQVHHLLEQFLRELGVELAADLVDQPRPRDAQGEVERQRQQDAEREHPQGRHRPCWG